MPTRSAHSPTTYSFTETKASVVFSIFWCFGNIKLLAAQKPTRTLSFLPYFVTFFSFISRKQLLCSLL